MTTIQLDSVPIYYQRYVELVRHLDVFDALRQSQKQMNEALLKITPEKENYAYQPGKWTVKELLCHIADAERIFSYRALSFSRNDQTPLPGFDENAYVPESNARGRKLELIKNELNNLRASTIDLFNSFSETQLQRKGLANNTEISVLTLGYVISGHEVHHLNILKERYFVQ